MAGSDRPDETGENEPGRASPLPVSDGELDRRRRQLDRELSRQHQESREGAERAKSGIASGYAVALRLSSEFIAGILFGAAIGWVIDRFAGTSPWGLIVFLLLGFCAGILSILRSAGMVAERGASGSGKDAGRADRPGKDTGKADRH
ncbi:MAG: AtpZ/AtpI family protein [Hyphomicrobiales bacterium]|nr:AtpZ/AtpI family protein [Hyphomicrobiales bacterium]